MIRGITDDMTNLIIQLVTNSVRMPFAKDKKLVPTWHVPQGDDKPQSRAERLACSEAAKQARNNGYCDGSVLQVCIDRNGGMSWAVIKN